MESLSNPGERLSFKTRRVVPIRRLVELSRGELDEGNPFGPPARLLNKRGRLNPVSLFQRFLRAATASLLFFEVFHENRGKRGKAVRNSTGGRQSRGRESDEADIGKFKMADPPESGPGR